MGHEENSRNDWDGREADLNEGPLGLMPSRARSKDTADFKGPLEPAHSLLAPERVSIRPQASS